MNVYCVCLRVGASSSEERDIKKGGREGEYGKGVDFENHSFLLCLKTFV